MAKVYGEAIQDPQSKKWGYIMGHEDGGVILEPDYIFDTKQEAERELIDRLKNLRKHV